MNQSEKRSFKNYSPFGKRGASNQEMLARILAQRSLLFAALAGVLLFAGVSVYLALGRDRMELVFLTEDFIDKPTLLEKVRSSTDPVASDRWVRGFVGAFIQAYYLHEDDSAEMAKEAVSWLHAVTGPAGQKRSAEIMSGFDKWDAERRRRYDFFVALNDMSTVSIRQSAKREDIVFVEVPGTYFAKNQTGTAIFDARLKLVLRKVAISGIPTSLGKFNKEGLIVESGFISYVEDYTRSTERTDRPLFQSLAEMKRYLESIKIDDDFKVDE